MNPINSKIYTLAFRYYNIDIDYGIISQVNGKILVQNYKIC